jgi:hypothetical protein
VLGISIVFHSMLRHTFMCFTNSYFFHLSIVIVHSFHAVLDNSAPELRLLLYPFSVSEEDVFAMEHVINFPELILGFGLEETHC